MRKLLALLLLGGSACFGQGVGTIFFQTVVNTAAVAATPSFSPGAGTYTGGQSVTISTTTPGATICYTTDGSTPTATTPGTCTNGTTYSGAVSVASSLTIETIATEAGYQNSAVGSAAYTINPAVLPTLVQTVQTCSTGTACTITATTAGDMLLVMGVTGGGLGDWTAVSASASGGFTHATACNYQGSGLQPMDAWYLTNIAGGDTSVTVTAGHSAGYAVFEVSHANTFQGCLTINTSTAQATSPAPSYNAGSDQFIAQLVNSGIIDSINAASLPASTDWTGESFNASFGTPGGYAIPSAAATYQYVGTNHNSNTATSGGISIAFAN